MRHQIKKQPRVFVAVIVLFVVAMAIAAFMSLCALISLGALAALPHRSGELDSR